MEILRADDAGDDTSAAGGPDARIGAPKFKSNLSFSFKSRSTSNSTSLSDRARVLASDDLSGLPRSAAVAHALYFASDAAAQSQSASTSLHKQGQSDHDGRLDDATARNEHETQSFLRMHELCPEIIRRRHTELGIHKDVERNCEALQNMATSVEDLVHIGAFDNPSRTGLWDEEGHLCERAFAALAKRAVFVHAETRGLPPHFSQTNTAARLLKNGGVDFILLREHFEALRASVLCTSAPTHVTVGYVIPYPITYAALTKTSLDTLFAHFADYTYCGQPALSTARAREFYSDPCSLFHKKADGTLFPPISAR